MSREIKFRFVFKKADDVHFAFFSLDEICNMHLKADIETEEEYGYSLISEDRGTGLKDKHGKEGYQDDIVEVDGVIWLIVWNAKSACFELQFKGGSFPEFFTMPMCLLECGKIIGNTWRNPKLLNNEENKQ